MKYKEIALELTDGIATLWLNRPNKNNAFNAEMIRELIHALKKISNDTTIRFFILRGRGKHFSAGADLGWMKDCAKLNYEENLADSNELAELMYQLYHLPQPSLSVVQGAAFGGALGLIACCDLAIGATDAVLSLSEVHIGLSPAVISPFVVKAIGERNARRYALSAERFNGETATKLGLFAECYEADKLDDALTHWLKIFSANSPQAMKTTKLLLIDVAEGKIDEHIRLQTVKTIAKLRVTPEAQEGLSAFFEKRTPNWQKD